MKINKKIILIGKTSCGKTTLSQFLNSEQIKYKKTQTLEVINCTIIDTPGEFLEQHRLKGAILTSSYNAQIIVLLHSAVDENFMFPPAFSSMFTKPIIGVVTKKDIATDKQISNATKHLQIAGAKDIFAISSVQNDGLDELIDFINNYEV